MPGPVAIDARQAQVGALKKGLHRPRLSAIIPNLTAAGSHPDCRAVFIQIVALQILLPRVILAVKAASLLVEVSVLAISSSDRLPLLVQQRDAATVPRLALAGLVLDLVSRAFLKSR